MLGAQTAATGSCLSVSHQVGEAQSYAFVTPSCIQHQTSENPDADDPGHGSELLSLMMFSDICVERGTPPRA